jgi:hypothetical protein
MGISLIMSTRGVGVTCLHAPQKDSISQNPNSLACNDTPFTSPHHKAKPRHPKKMSGLENYTFLTFGMGVERTNVYASRRGPNLSTFSNSPHLALFTTQYARRRGA